MFFFEKIVPYGEDWTIIENSIDSSCFLTIEWRNFVKSIGYNEFCVKISNKEGLIAYFVGQRISFGLISIIASPFDGCGYTQGLCFIHSVTKEERIMVYTQLADWIFKNRYASMIQIDDWQLKEVRDTWTPKDQIRIHELDSLGIHYHSRPTLFVNLNRDENELWAGLHYKSCKYCVNKANKLGLRVEYITNEKDIERFCGIHFSQLVSVCKTKGTKPTIGQSQDRMVKLCKALFPHRVIMSKVLGLDDKGQEQVMSTAIFCVDKGQCIYWTGASIQKYQKYCPNELMVWESMKKISSMGGGDLNFGGIASYKLKYGTKYAYVPRLIFQKYPRIYEAKAFAKSAYYYVRRTFASFSKI